MSQAARVLDVGCGSGLFFSHVASQAGMVVGVDISCKLLRKAKMRADETGNAFVLQADADRLPFPDGFFDFVFSFTVLQNMPKPAQMLNELKRASKIGGRIIVSGLKRTFSLNAFMDFLEGTGLKLISFVDNECLNCYVAVLAV